jgi:hypothetical protein
MSNQGYHISKGADDIYWILNDGDIFVKNLSTDLETAKIKAKEKIGFVPPVTIWHRQKFIYSKPEYRVPDWLLFNDHITTYKKHLAAVKFLAAEKDCESRQYVGSVGDVLELELILTDLFAFDGDYGSCNCYKFKDSNNNRFIYFGNSGQLDCFKDVGDKFKVTFEVKRQYEDLTHDVVPYKLNHITKVKTNTPKMKWELTQIDNYEIGIREIWVEYYSKKDYKFYFIDNDHNKNLFYPKNIKTFKAAKELLYDLNGLNNEGKLSKNYLININN